MPLPRPLGQFTSEPVGVQIYENGVLTDPDGQVVTLSIVNTTNNNQVLVPVSTASTRLSTGVYAYQLQSTQTSTLGLYQVNWVYTMNGNPRVYSDPFQITPPMQWWQNLLMNERQMVVNCFSRVENSWDMTAGGPY